ncbi:VanW family protein [Kallotenue papyrolyticum]|uniref:VanW family protein n=1 Tax=Kallotenue papyrolyticum TaxID=1325125 RepID=UPI000478555D|nr:VanW family protein [Kallotenue papyrolyticum]
MQPIQPTDQQQIIAALLEAGMSALHAGSPSRAEVYFRQVLRLEPRAIPAWQGLAATQTGARRQICLRWVAYLSSAAQPRPRRARPIQAAGRRWQPAAGLVGLTLLATMLGSDLVYRERLLPGVRIGVLEVSHLPWPVALDRLEQAQQRYASRVLELEVAGQRRRVAAGTLLRADAPQQALQQAFHQGHHGHALQRALQRAQAWLGDTYQVTFPLIDAAALEQLIATLAQEVERPMRDAQLLDGAQGWSIVPEQIGRVLDRAATRERLSAAVHRLASATDHMLRVEVVVHEQPPRISSADLEALRQQLAALRAQPLTVQAGDQIWTLDRSLLMHWSASGDPASVQPDSRAIEQQVARLASQVARPPQASRLLREGDRVREFVPGAPGLELDQTVAREQLLAALHNGATQVTLPLREVPPPPGESERLGLLAELGRGESQFASYSSPARDANVAIGGQEIDGVLIPPGAIFSFNATVGAITAEKGYRWGEMIEAGSVVPALGGGICQVSTTVFRAALHSGLEIIERHPHSWRLPWYEVDAPPGMDATIALGGPDLKFRNNTPGYLLIRVATDLQQKRQTVRIYGTPDGRQVALEAIVANGAVGIVQRVTDAAQTHSATFLSYYAR